MGTKGEVANSRNTDPNTSHKAARDVEAAGTATTQRDLCLSAVCRCPGSTAGEISAATGIDRHTVSKRLPELRERKCVRNGKSRKCRSHGTQMMTWWPVATASQAQRSDTDASEERKDS